MGKSRKGNSKRHNQKTRRYKLKGGETKAALYVWKNPHDKTFHKRIFVDDGMDYGDSIVDAGYQLRWFAGEDGNTIPRKPDGTNTYQDIKPYVKYLTADYSEGKEGVNYSDSAKTGSAYTPPPPSAPPPQSVSDINAKISKALAGVKKDELEKIAKNLGISLIPKSKNDKLIQLIKAKLVE